MRKLSTIVGLALVAFTASTQAAPITSYLRENNSAFSGNAVTTTPFDDTFVGGIFGGTGSTTINGTGGSNASLRTNANNLDAGLIGLKNLFTLVPATSGGNAIVITSATLHLYANSSFAGTAGSTVTVSRATSNWLPDAAGTNEGDVSGRYREVSSTSNWAVGNTFSPSDYAAGGTTQVWNAATTNALNSFDVTALVSSMYTTGANYGFVLTTSSTSTLQVRLSEQANATTPVLQITYDYVPVPEPASAALIALGGLALLCGRRP